MSRLGAKIRRERAQEARVARRLIRELLPPPPSTEPAPERLGGAEPHAEALPAPAFAHPFEPAIAVLLVLILVALFGAVSALGHC